MSGTVQIILAIIGIIPALVAAIYAADTRRHVNTKNGKNIAAYVIEAQEVLAAVSEALGQVQKDIKPPSHETIGEAVEKTHALAAVTLAHTSELLDQSAAAKAKADV